MDPVIVGVPPGSGAPVPVLPTPPTRYTPEEARRRLLLCDVLIDRKRGRIFHTVGRDPGGFDVYAVGRLIAGLGRLHQRYHALLMATGRRHPYSFGRYGRGGLL